MLKFLSVNNIVIAAANTGNEISRRNAVTNTAQTNNDIRCVNRAPERIFKIVTIKLIAPKIELVPDRWKLKIAKSTDGPECPWIDERGG